MGWLAAIGTFLQLVLLVAKWWFGLDAEKKAKIEMLKKEIPNAKTESDITRLFDDINGM